MVLFHCTTCNNRFPTFHPDHMPNFQPECFKDCSVDGHEWHNRPESKTTQHATLHRGLCKRCHKSLQKAAEKPLLHEVATFSARNNWDPLFGLDVGAAYKEWLYLSQNATVVESMLIALNHMQVSVCYLTSRGNLSKGQRDSRLQEEHYFIPARCCRSEKLAALFLEPQ